MYLTSQDGQNNITEYQDMMSHSDHQTKAISSQERLQINYTNKKTLAYSKRHRAHGMFARVEKFLNRGSINREFGRL